MPGRGLRYAVRLGFNYVRGLRQETAEAIVAARPFASIGDLVRRVPGLRKTELRMLAEIGALNGLVTCGAGRLRPAEADQGVGCGPGGPPYTFVAHRRDALWEAERALRPAGPLFDEIGRASGSARDVLVPYKPAGRPPADQEVRPTLSPLAQMTDPERMRADYFGTGLTIGSHPMRLYRAAMEARGVLPASALKRVQKGRTVRVAGCVICRQRPGTAKGIVFLSLEDETGIANAIVAQELFDQHRAVLTSAPYLMIEGLLQNQQGAISVKVRYAEALDFAQIPVRSHDFH